MPHQQEILETLVKSWVMSAQEFVAGVDTIDRYFMHGYIDQHTSFADAYFDQGGRVRTSPDIDGLSLNIQRCFSLQRSLRSALESMAVDYQGEGLPAPVEVRVQFHVGSGGAETQLLFEPSFDPTTTDPVYGIVTWLGDLAPKVRM